MCWKHLASSELFSPMLSSTFSTIPVVPTTFYTSNTTWSNSLQRQHILPIRVAFQSDTALSAQPAMTLPQWVCIPLILHQPRCGSCWGGHWLSGHSDLQCWLQGPPVHRPPPSFVPVLAFSVPGKWCSPLIYHLCPVPSARVNEWVYRMGIHQP